jgi:hypothetical protein
MRRQARCLCLLKAVLAFDATYVFGRDAFFHTADLGRTAKGRGSPIARLACAGCRGPFAFVMFAALEENLGLSQIRSGSRIGERVPSDDLTEPMKEIGGCLAVDACQIRRDPRRHASDEKLRQSILRLFLQTTAAYPIQRS